MQSCMLLFLLSIVLLLARVAADPDIMTNRRSSESFSETQSVELLRQLIMGQQSIATTDCVAAESDELARELCVMMAATLGRIEEFDGAKEEWCQYQERLEHFFRANEIEDETKKHSVFLTLLGANVYKLLQNLTVPEKNRYKDIRGTCPGTS